MNDKGLASISEARLGVEVTHFLRKIVPTPKSLNFLYYSATSLKYILRKPLQAFASSCRKFNIVLLFVFPGVSLSADLPSLN